MGLGRLQPGCNCCGGIATCEDCFPGFVIPALEVDLDGIGVFTAANTPLGGGDAACVWNYDAGVVSCSNPEIWVWIGVDGWYVGFGNPAANTSAVDYRAGPFTECDDIFGPTLTLTPVAGDICSLGSVDAVVTPL